MRGGHLSANFGLLNHVLDGYLCLLITHWRGSVPGGEAQMLGNFLYFAGVMEKSDDAHALAAAGAF
jgi:hypothetical protein